MTNPSHGMACPVCNVPLVMSERQGVEIDYCAQCRGVWLDRGELDKIIERNANSFAAPPVTPQQHQPSGGYVQRTGHGQGYPKKRKSFLEELFD